MKNLKNKKGITLIALVITIIIMLLLVGVTVAISLNGGLFKTAKEAKTQTGKATEGEQLQAATIAAYSIDTKSVSKQKLQEDLPGWTIEGEEGSTYLCISPEGNTFTVGQDGTILDLPERVTAEVPEGWIPLYTADDLAAVASGEENREIRGTTYTMAADANYIVMQNIYFENNEEFVPIEGFIGNFDGNNCVINNLTINQPGGYKALFGQVSGDLSGKKIEQIILNNVDINGSGCCASIIGSLKNTGTGEFTISKCIVEGKITANGPGPVAGIVCSETNNGSEIWIDDCSVRCKLTGR